MTYDMAHIRAARRGFRLERLVVPLMLTVPLAVGALLVAQGLAREVAREVLLGLIVIVGNAAFDALLITTAVRLHARAAPPA